MSSDLFLISVDFFLTAILWVLGILGVAFIGAQIVLFAMLIWVGVVGDWKEARFLANTNCPHCGVEFGRDAARSAIYAKGVSRSKPESRVHVYYVPEKVIVCVRCQAPSFWYPMTYTLSPERNEVLGIVESRRKIASK